MGQIHKRHIPHGITKSTTEVQEKENLIKRDFSADKPLEKVLSDITEIQCSKGKLYASTVIDCFNREVLAFAMDDSMKKNCV